MELTLRYGRDGLPVALPDNVDVVTTRFTPGLPDEAAAIYEALRQPIASPPLASLVKSGDKVVVEMTPYDLTKGRITFRVR